VTEVGATTRVVVAATATASALVVEVGVVLAVDDRRGAAARLVMHD